MSADGEVERNEEPRLKSWKNGSLVYGPICEEPAYPRNRDFCVAHVRFEALYLGIQVQIECQKDTQIQKELRREDRSRDENMEEEKKNLGKWQRTSDALVWRMKALL